MSVIFGKGTGGEDNSRLFSYALYHLKSPLQEEVMRQDYMFVLAMIVGLFIGYIMGNKVGKDETEEYIRARAISIHKQYQDYKCPHCGRRR